MAERGERGPGGLIFWIGAGLLVLLGASAYYGLQRHRPPAGPASPATGAASPATGAPAGSRYRAYLGAEGLVIDTLGDEQLTNWLWGGAEGDGRSFGPHSRSRTDDTITLELDRRAGRFALPRVWVELARHGIWPADEARGS